jgi:hypothetical protein
MKPNKGVRNVGGNIPRMLFTLWVLTLLPR